MRPFSRIKSEVGTVVAEKEADFAYDDDRLARRWKRRRIANENCKLYSCSNKAPKKTIKNNNKEAEMEVVTIDSDYESFLNDMEQLVVDNDVDSVDDGVNCDGPVTLVRNDDGDPQYMMFLDNLKADGNSYVLTLPFGNVTPLVVKYEKEDEADVENLETMKGFAVNENIKSGHIWKGPSEREKIEGPRRNLKSSLEREKIENPRRVLKSCSWRDKTESPRKFFRSDIRRENDETLNNLHYLVKGEKTGKPRTFRNSPRRKNMEARKTLRNVQMIDRKTPVEKNVEMEAENLFNCTTNDCESDLMDESYQAFLNSVEEVGQNLVYAPEGGEKVVYEKDESGDSDSEVVILDNNLYSNGDYTPFISSKSYFLSDDIDGEGCTGSFAGSKSHFREKLMEILQKPYDQKEFTDLMGEVSQRRPLVRYIELRGVTKRVILDSYGKSYLDMFSDLHTKIRGVRDRRRVLNVLRGFFYWLQNLALEGEAFKPWLDASCLKALPRV
ncbi:hypothetical protein ACOSP7_030159 [Xanthoceras sorbifolium]